MIESTLISPLADNLKIRSANSILIVGGGPTGVELAGEIVTDYPEKKITLVHTGSRLLEFIGPKAANKTLNWFKSRNVDVILEQSVSLNTISDSPGSKIYHTSEGERFEADCHFLCIGKRVGSAWLKETVLKNSLDINGTLMVDENLRVIGRKNVFAVGDITNLRVSADCNLVIFFCCFDSFQRSSFKVQIQYSQNSVSVFQVWNSLV